MLCDIYLANAFVHYLDGEIFSPTVTAELMFTHQSSQRLRIQTHTWKQRPQYANIELKIGILVTLALENVYINFCFLHLFVLSKSPYGSDEQKDKKDNCTIM